MAKISVVVADDHSMVREGLKAAIRAEPDMEVVAEAEDGHQAVDIALEKNPDVIVVDLMMPGMGGVEATEVIAECCPDTKVVALTMHESAPFLRSFLAAGGVGYILKKSAGRQLMSAIRSVKRGQRFLDPKLGEPLLQDLIFETRNNRSTTEPSQREREVIRLVAQGYSSQQVADRMRVSVKTVESYRARVSRKLGLKTRPEIVRYAVENHLLTPEDFIPAG